MMKGSSAGSSSSGGSDSGINGFAIGALVIAVLLVAVILLSVLARKRSSPVSSHYYMDESGLNRQFNSPLLVKEIYFCIMLVVFQVLLHLDYG
jgi:hypothetical protein